MLLAVAVLVLVVGGVLGYRWLVRDVAQRQAVAQHQTLEPAPVNGDMDVAPPEDPAPALMPVPVDEDGEPLAPAVLGDSINKCVKNGRVTFTNQACPEGSEQSAPGTDQGGIAVAGRATVRQPTAAEDQKALCNYIVAEIERLGHEFQQTLPPPVLDHISTDLTVLREQGETHGCKLPSAANDAS